MDFNGFFTVGEMFWQGHSVKDSKLNAFSLVKFSVMFLVSWRTSNYGFRRRKL